jgi:hypothetical protein
MGEGRNPRAEHLLQLAKESNFKKQKAEEIVEQIQSCLENWTGLAKNYGVSNTNSKLIQSKLNTQRQTSCHRPPCGGCRAQRKTVNSYCHHAQHVGAALAAKKLLPKTTNSAISSQKKNSE